MSFDPITGWSEEDDVITYYVMKKPGRLATHIPLGNEQRFLCGGPVVSVVLVEKPTKPLCKTCKKAIDMVKRV